jgi:CDP-diacylglycerol--glycerol-3-phosphate 3-phosphatidyltransferase
MLSNLPLLLTWLRILIIPVIVWSFYQNTSWSPALSASLFVFAGITDWADGYFARLWQQESRFGAFLDPVADKLIVAVVLILIVEREANLWVTLAACIIIGREIIISALREWMAESGKRSKVAVAYIGKVKTTVQFIALACLLYNQDLWGLPIRSIGFLALVIATVLTVVSMVQYLLGAFRHP